MLNNFGKRAKFVKDRKFFKCLLVSKLEKNYDIKYKYELIEDDSYNHYHLKLIEDISKISSDLILLSQEEINYNICILVCDDYYNTSIPILGLYNDIIIVSDVEITIEEFILEYYMNMETKPINKILKLINSNMNNFKLSYENPVYNLCEKTIEHISDQYDIDNDYIFSKFALGAAFKKNNAIRFNNTILLITDININNIIENINIIDSYFYKYSLIKIGDLTELNIPIDIAEKFINAIDKDAIIKRNYNGILRKYLMIIDEYNEIECVMVDPDTMVDNKDIFVSNVYQVGKGFDIAYVIGDHFPILYKLLSHTELPKGMSFIPFNFNNTVQEAYNFSVQNRLLYTNEYISIDDFINNK